MQRSVIVPLRQEAVPTSPVVVVDSAPFKVTAFTWHTGVKGLRIDNEVGHIVMLPFQGQQIWDAVFAGRRLTMRSMFDAPVPTTDYLSNYGGFFLHCGASAMGNPSPNDNHPTHGELPNARYEEVRLEFGEDEAGPFVAVRGESRQTKAFAYDYVARPTVRMRPASMHIEVELEIENRKRSPMDLMYLAHINLRPIDGGQLIDAVVEGRDRIDLRATLPAGLEADQRSADYFRAVSDQPGVHRTLVAGQHILPELVLSMRPAAGADGWTHAVHRHPDGTGDFVSYRPDQLGRAIRWITRGPDQDALGLFLPATADADGFVAARSRGDLVVVPPGGRFHCALRFGALDSAGVAAMEQQIAAIRNRAGATGAIPTQQPESRVMDRALRRHTGTAFTDIDFDRQGKQVGFIMVPHSPNDDAWGVTRIPIAVIANGSGPTVLIEGGNHGDEYEGPITIAELSRELDPHNVQGRLILMPAINLHAVAAGQRVSPVDQLNFNRVFPGDPAGTITEQIAAFVTDRIFPLADVFLDLHSGGSSLDILPSAIIEPTDDKELHRRNVAAVLAFDAPYAVVISNMGDQRTATATACNAGIVTVGTEMGGAGTVSLEALRICRRGVRNVLAHVGLIAPSDDPPTPTGNREVLELRGSDAYVFATADGVFEPFHANGASVSAGEPAGRIHCTTDLTQDPVMLRYLADGIVFGRRHPGRVKAGNCCLAVASRYEGQFG